MKPLLFLVFFIFSSNVFSSVRIFEELYIPGKGPEVVRELIETGSVEIDHVTSEGFELYGPEGTSQYLDQLNIVYLDMKSTKMNALSRYPSSAEIAQKLKKLAEKYPHIMELKSIGKSVRGQDLWVMKISDNVATDEVEPEFKYISSMHGDEITGRELSLLLIDEIGQKYGRDSEITELVNNTEIFILPSMNPDGSDMKQRGNANYVDLNRNFPDIVRDTESKPQGRAVENQHVMKFQASRHFALSANFHGGTIVVNYPWDSKYELHPLDAFIKELSQDYADLNPDMRSSQEFPGGITNGAAWYVVRGGMQDWSYFWHNDLQITLELSHRKWPDYSEIPRHYKNNRDSLFNYMKEVHRGAGFKFSGPKVSGSVEITQNYPVTQNLGTFSFYGSEFYKVLPEGEYSFKIKNNNTKSVKVISTKVEKNQIPTNGHYILIN